MFAIIEGGKIINVYSKSTPPLTANQSVIACIDVIPDYDARYQIAIAPASVANAPSSYRINNDGVGERLFSISYLNIETLKKNIIDEIKTLRKSSDKRAVFYRHDDTLCLMHSDDITITNVTSKYQNLLISGATATWYFDDGEKAEIDSNKASAMLLLVTTKDQELRDIADTHITAINAMQSINDVIEYDITNGW